jgi:hypothetical protein
MNLADPHLARQGWAGITPGSSGDVVGADLRSPRYLRLNQTPIEGKSSTHNHNSGTSLSSAIYVDAISANVDQLTERRWSRLGLRRDRKGQH